MNKICFYGSMSQFKFYYFISCNQKILKYIDITIHIKKSLSPFAHKHQKCMQCIKIFLGVFFSLDMKNTTIIYKSLILLLLLKAIRPFHKFHFIAFLSSNLSGDGGIIRSRGGPPRIDKSWL